MNGVRNSRCNVKSLNFRFERTPTLSSLSASSLPPWKCSAVLPSKSTTAPLGAFAPSVADFRITFFALKATSSSAVPLNTPPATPPVMLRPLNVTLPPAVWPLSRVLVLPSQPAPGKPPA